MPGTLPSPPAAQRPAPVHGWARLAADLLTAARAAIALGIGALAWRGAPAAALRAVVLASLAAWSTDLLDGPLARYSRTAPSRLGSADVWVDLLLHWCTALALGLAGWVPLWALGLWAGAFALLHWFYPTNTVRWGFAAPLAVLPLALALGHAPSLARLYLAWVTLALILRGERLSDVIAEFISGLPAPARIWLDRHLPRRLGGGRRTG